METAIKKAVRIAGTQENLAHAVGVDRGSVAQWVRKGRVSFKSVKAVSEVSGIPLHELRPDIYPSPEKIKKLRIIRHGSDLYLTEGLNTILLSKKALSLIEEVRKKPFNDWPCDLPIFNRVRSPISEE